MERKLSSEIALQTMRKVSKDKSLEAAPIVGAAYAAAMSNIEGCDNNNDEEDDKDPADDFLPEDEVKPRRRIVTAEVWSEQSSADKMPAEYRHLRKGPRKIKPEFYRVVDKLMSVFHCSYAQAVAGVIEAGNLLFNRHWKYHGEDPDRQIDRQSNRQTRPVPA